MDLQAESPRKTPQPKVFSSMENRSELLEARLKLPISEMKQHANKKPVVKDPSFYAIQHVTASPSKENNEEESSKKTKRKRTTEIKKQRPCKTRVIEEPQLYQTCNTLWPKESQLVEYDYVKDLSNLLKVRLSQAKFKMLAKLDQDNELFTFLSEEYALPQPKQNHLIHFSNKNKSCLSVVGSSKNLFNRQMAPLMENNNIETVTSSPPAMKKTKKKATPQKVSSQSTPKKKSIAADIAPITLEDGTSVYICEPCNKKYKNRNGLAYHLERCKNKQQIICCSCNHNEENGSTLSQCELCKHWSHSDCVVTQQEVFHCHNCSTTPTTTTSTSSPPAASFKQEDEDAIGKNLLQSLLDEMVSTPHTSTPHSQIVSTPHTTTPHSFIGSTPLSSQEYKDEDEEQDSAEEEVFQMTSKPVEEEEDIHIWDDFTTTIENNSWLRTTEEDEDEEPFSTMTDVPTSSSQWDIDLFSQPPSLLFSDQTIASSMDDLSSQVALIGDLNTPTPQTDVWFQFANFDDDYCEQ